MKQQKWRVLLSLLLAMCFCLSAITPVYAADGLWGGFGAQPSDTDWSNDLKDSWKKLWDKIFGGSEEEEPYSASNDLQYRIVHLDCGRKYFSVDYIMGVIDTMYANGFNQLELAFGNGGLRFVLDNMDIVSGGSMLHYSNEVKEAIKQGNEKFNEKFYDDPNGNYLTEEDMKQIIAYAEKKGIEIVPLLNMPGHMDALLSSDLFSKYKLTGKNDKNEDKVAVDSIDLQNQDAVAFAKGLLTLYVNWFKIYSVNTKHFNFGADEYANGIQNPYLGTNCAKSTYADMTNFMNDCAEIIESVGMTARCFNDFVCYQNKTNCAVSKTIEVCYWSNQGSWAQNYYTTAAIIKSDGYNMINTNQKWYYVPSKPGEYSKETVLSNFKTFDVTKYQNVTAEYNLASNDYTVISVGDQNVGAMFCVWCDTPSVDVELSDVKDLIAAMADANPTYFTKVTEPEKPVIIPSDGATKGLDGTYGVTAGGSFTLRVSDGENAAWTVFPAGIVNLTADSTVNGLFGVLANETSLIASAVKVTAVTAGTATITATLADKTALTATVTVTEPGKVPVELEVGETKTVTVDGDVTVPDGYDKSVATITAEKKSSVGTDRVIASSKTTPSATNQYSGVFKVGNNYLAIKDDGTGVENFTDVNKATIFTVTTKSQNSSDKYTTISATVDGTTYYLGYSNNGDLTITTIQLSDNWFCGGDSDFFRTDVTNYQNARYLTCDNGTWSAKGKWNEGKLAFLYAVNTDYVPGGNQTTLIFTGVTPGKTSVTIGGVQYTITVKEEVLENRYIYVNYFITNLRVTGIDENQSIQIKASDKGINTEDGVTLASLVASTGKYQSGDVYKDVIYYKSEYQHGVDAQTHDGWTNKIGTGVVAKRIRYYDKKWEVYNGQEWVEIVGNTKIDPETYAGKSAPANADLAVITAYYLLKTEVTVEIITNATDWGEQIGTYGTDHYSLLDFAVKYESGNRVPDTFANSKTLVYENNADKDYVYGNKVDKARYIKDIYAQNTSEYEVYMITVTESEALKADSSRSITSTTTITYPSDNEKVVWILSQDDLANSDFNSEDKKYEGFKVGGEPVVENIYAADKHGYLVTYYVRAKAPDLDVYYHVQGNETWFYHYGIRGNADKTKGLFSEDFGRDSNGNLINNTVVNDKGNTETVLSDLKSMPAIPAQYRYSDYKCVDATVSNDRTEVHLYYTISSDVTFVVDFGQPFTIIPRNVNVTLENAAIDGARVEYPSSLLTIDYSDATKIKVTPEKVIDGEINFKLTYSGSIKLEDGTQTGTVTYNVKILPASNVLYEESFFDVTGEAANNWTRVGSSADRSQATEKLGEKSNNYGFDPSYAGDNGFSGGSALKAEVKIGATDNPVANFSFVGTGFDIISECSYNTGWLYAVVTDDNGVREKAYLINTHLKGDGLHIKNGAMTYQIPVVRCTDVLKYGKHNVSITGVIYSKPDNGTEASTNVVNAFSVNALNSIPSDVYMMLASLGVSESDMMDVEVIDVEDTIESIRAYDASDRLYAVNSTENDSDSEKYYVYLDGFRVYNSLGFDEKDSATVDGTTSSEYSGDGEEGFKYLAAYKQILNDSQNQSATVYLESNPDSLTGITVAEYRKFGPYNEVYLIPGSVLAINLGNTNKEYVQLSAKKINESASVASVKMLQYDSGKKASTATQELNTSTEMYYKVKVEKIDGTSYIIVGNSTDSNGILSIAELKLPNDANLQPVTESEQSQIVEAVQAMFSAPVDPVDPEPEPEPETFEPQLLEAYAPAVAFRRWGATITVTSSIEEGMEVYIRDENGESMKLTPNNTRMVRWGMADTYRYSFSTGRLSAGTHTYYVYAVKDGLESAPVAVTITVW